MKNIIILLGLIFPILAFGQDTNTNESKDFKNVNNKKQDFKNVAKAPKFKGDINEYLIRNIKYPEIAKSINLEGVVTISFVVDEKGNVVDAEVVKGIGSGCDEEALRVVKAMPQFEPAMQNGKYVKMYYSLNVRFTIDDKNNQIKDNEEIVENPDHEAEFSGGIAQYLVHNFKAPTLSKKERKQIKFPIEVSFIIEKDGSISNIKFDQHLIYEYDIEIRRVLNQMPKWKPAIKDGLPVRTRFKLSFNYIY